MNHQDAAVVALDSARAGRQLPASRPVDIGDEGDISPRRELLPIHLYKPINRSNTVA